MACGGGCGGAIVTGVSGVAIVAPVQAGQQWCGASGTTRVTLTPTSKGGAGRVRRVEVFALNGATLVPALVTAAKVGETQIISAASVTLMVPPDHPVIWQGDIITTPNQDLVVDATAAGGGTVYVRALIDLEA